jgi:hypothetical protein
MGGANLALEDILGFLQPPAGLPPTLARRMVGGWKGAQWAGAGYDKRSCGVGSWVGKSGKEDGGDSVCRRRGGRLCKGGVATLKAC